MIIPNFDCPSPSGGDELHDSALMLEYGSEAKGSELQDHDGVRNSSPIQYFSSDSDEAQVHTTSPDFEPPLPLNDNKSSPAEQASNHLILDEQMKDNKPLIAGAGLANLGNTCFLNSVLQCFMHTVPLLDGILSDARSAHSNCNGGGFCMQCSLRQLVELSLSSTNRVVLPWDLVNNLSYFSSSFQRFQQEDAHEFLQSFLDRLESAYESKQKDVSSPSENLVKQVFGGRLVSKLKCCSCGHSSNTHEPSIDVSLEIGDANDLLTALQSFTKVEKLEDPEIKFTCENCKLQVSVEKQLSFDQVPSVAAFHLKKFRNDGCLVQKIDKHVAFPLELDLSPFMDSDKKKDAELKYVLYAAVVHTGSTPTSGHYYCFIRLSPRVWCKFDDSMVVLVHEDYVLSQDAYILFYAKEGIPLFTSYIEASKLGLDSTLWNTSPKSVLENASSVSPLPQNELTSDSGGARDDGEPEDVGIDKTEAKCIGFNEVESNKMKDESHRMAVSAAAPFACEPSTVSSPEDKQEVSLCLDKDIHQSQEISRVGNSRDGAETAARSPSPEIYREDPPDAGFSIPRKHLKLVDRISCKRRLEKDMDDLETRQACSFIKKSIPGSRRQQLLYALKESRSSVNRKIARIR